MSAIITPGWLPQLAEIQRVLNRKCQVLHNLCNSWKANSQNVFLNIFFNQPSNWKLWKEGKILILICLWFYFILFCQQTRCTKKARKNAPSNESTKNGLNDILGMLNKSVNIFVNCICHSRINSNGKSASPLLIWWQLQQSEKMLEMNLMSNVIIMLVNVNILRYEIF